MKKINKIEKGSVSEEQISLWLKSSMKARFKWLEESHDFVARALTPEKLATMEKLRRGRR